VIVLVIRCNAQRLPNRWSSERHQACLFGRVATEVGGANVSSFVLSKHNAAIKQEQKETCSFCRARAASLSLLCKYRNNIAEYVTTPLKIVKRKKNGNDMERNEYLCNLNFCAWVTTLSKWKVS
jgi:hypothetical protein